MTQPATPGRPTLAVVNARIATGDARRPWADGLAAAGATLVLVGSSAAVRKLVDATTRVIDGRGNTIVPGTLDAAAEFGEAWRALESTPGRLLARDAGADFVMVDPGRTRALLVVKAGVVAFEAD